MVHTNKGNHRNHMLRMSTANRIGLHSKVKNIICHRNDKGLIATESNTCFHGQLNKFRHVITHVCKSLSPNSLKDSNIHKYLYNQLLTQIISQVAEAARQAKLFAPRTETKHINICIR